MGIRVCGKLVLSASIVVFKDLFRVVFFIVIFRIILGRYFFRFFRYNGLGLKFFIFLFDLLKM